MKKLLFFLLITQIVHAQKLNHLPYGPHAVGFSSTLEFDYSRPSRTDGRPGRAIRVSVWYPATPARGTAMNFKEYIFLEGKEDSIVSEHGNDEAALKSFLSYPESSGADMTAWSRFFSRLQPMKAQRDAARKKRDFPVVQLIHGGAAVYSVIGEFLASQGIIAVNVPYKGYLQNQFDVSVAGMETEIRDHEYALDFVIRKYGITAKQIGLVGISFGGQSAVGYAVRNPNVKGIVSLDGGIGSTFGPQLLAGFPFYSLEKVTMPILHLYNPADPGGNIDWFSTADFNDRLLVSYNHMDHAFFGAFGLLDNDVPYVLGRNKPRAGDNAESVLLYTYTFLSDLFERQTVDRQKLIGLHESEGWMKEGVQSVNFKEKEYSPLPLSQLRKVLKANGLAGLEEVRARQTQMPISDGSYRALFLECFGKQDKVSSLKIAELYETDFPRSAFAQYYKGRALQLNDQNEKAKVCFEKCLSLIAGDTWMTFQEKETVKGRAEKLLGR